MNRTTRTIASALAALAILAPVATAVPSSEHGSASSPGEAIAAAQDQRSPDARDASRIPQTGMAVAAGQDVRTPDARDAGARPTTPVAGLPTTLIDPEPIVPVAGGDDTSPLVYILPGIALSLMLVAGFAYAVRTSDRDRRARISA